MKVLKIKDEIDLKELEKFGFELYDIGLNEPYYVYEKYIKPYISIHIYEDRTISKNNDDANGILKDEDIYDLIKADMVELMEV